MTLDIPLTTTRLQIRSLSPDAIGDAYLAWMTDPEVLRFLEVRFAPAQTRESLSAFVGLMNASARDWMFGIFLRDGDRHIGNIKIGGIFPEHLRADVGFLIGERAHWGQGYATEAIAAVSDFGFASLGLQKIIAGCYASNVGSVRALEKAGYAHEAVLPGHWRLDGRREDGLMLARHAS